MNHNWAIYVNPVGVDAAVQILHTRCTAAGYIWNPYYTQLADPLNVSYLVHLFQKALQLFTENGNEKPNLYWGSHVYRCIATYVFYLLFIVGWFVPKRMWARSPFALLCWGCISSTWHYRARHWAQSFHRRQFSLGWGILNIFVQIVYKEKRKGISKSKLRYCKSLTIPFPFSEGKVSAMGRSIVIFNKDRGPEKFACANIGPDYDTVKYVNIRRPPKFVV